MSFLASDQINAYLTKKILQNLNIECLSDTQLVIKDGSAVGADDGSLVMLVSGDLTLDIATSGDGGLDTGAEAADTWYYAWLIWRPDTEAVSGIISASATAPTLPANYTKKRLIGVVRNNSSSNFIHFVQRNDFVNYIDSRIILSSVVISQSSWTGVDFTSFIPPISQEAACVVNGLSNDGSYDSDLSYTWDSAEIGSNGVYVVHGETGGQSIQQVTHLHMRTDSSQQIELRATASYSFYVYLLSVNGFAINI